eukprot:65789_1
MDVSCNGNLSNCECFEIWKKIIKHAHASDCEQIDPIMLLNCFLHLMDAHDNKHIRNTIHEQFEPCNNIVCPYSTRDYFNTMSSDLGDTIRLQIVDKTHCYFWHYYDFSNRSKRNEKISFERHSYRDKGEHETWDEYFTTSRRFSQSQRKDISTAHIRKYNDLGQSNQHQHIAINVEHEDDSFYHSGYIFEYQKRNAISRCFENKCCQTSKINVSPKYSSLKEEVITARKGYYILTIQQFEMEFKKANMYQNTHFCKSKFDESFTINHILSLLLYCNYTNIQYDFSKTYRDNKGRDHQEFYHWGLYLNEAVKVFGTRMCDGNIDTLYHGISKRLLFNLFVPGMEGLQLGCPLSTTYNLAVAVHFAYSNSGLVLEFCDGSAKTQSTSPRYFSVAWLSDFPNECECIFVQNSPSSDSLIIYNIINVRSGMEYKFIIYALYMRSMSWAQTSKHNAKLIEFCKERYHTLTCVRDCIWSFEFGGPEFVTDKYAQELITTYISKEKGAGLTILKLMAKIDYFINSHWKQWRFGYANFCFSAFGICFLFLVIYAHAYKPISYVLCHRKEMNIEDMIWHLMDVDFAFAMANVFLMCVLSITYFRIDFKH